jgi:L-aminopeptidase/D-esterase-like protein
MSQPGHRNAITDVEGFLVGQAHDARVGSGVSVVLCAAPSVCAVDVRGGGPGTRETDLLALDTLVEAVDALVLAGGSVYGLAAADGVVAALGAAGRGYRIAQDAPTAPIVPAAILFDLMNGGAKDWGEDPPYRRLGQAALAAAGPEVAEGNAGAGFGALAGGVKGGLGSASLLLPDGAVVGALAAANSHGGVLMPGSRAFWAWPFEMAGEFGSVPPPAGPIDPLDWGATKTPPLLRASTTLAVIACDYDLTRAEARRVAVMAQDGLARAIRPVHAPYDGDVVFVLASGRRPLPSPRPRGVLLTGAVAADTLSRAVARGVYAAQSLFGRPAWRDLDETGAARP